MSHENMKRINNVYAVSGLSSELSVKRLASLDAVRVFAVWSVVLYHINLEWQISIRLMSFGVYGVYLCFALSGFLCGYRSGRETDSYRLKQSLDIYKRKWRKFFPLHLISFLLAAFLNVLYYITYGTTVTAVAKDCIKAVFNVLLLQSFVPKESFYFSYNGVAWYLSSLMFLYFLSPLLVHLLDRIPAKLRISGILSLGVLGIILEVLTMDGSLDIWFLYISPFYNCFVFSEAILAGMIRRDYKENDGKCSVPATILELVILGGAYPAVNFLCYCFPFASYPILSLCAILIVTVLSFERGWISAFAGIKIWGRLASFSFEVYMFHQVVVHYLLFAETKISIPVYAGWIFSLVFTLFLSVSFSQIRKKIYK